MRFTNPYSRDLGTFTWAELQAAYPNGGGALAALPAGTTAFVSDWGALFTPNAAKTYWFAAGRTRIVFDVTTQTGDTTGNNQVVKQALLPSKILRACSKFIVFTSLGKNGAVDAATSETLKLGTAGTTSDATIKTITALSSGNRSLAVQNEFIVYSSTVLRDYGALNNLAWGGQGSGVTSPQSFAVSNVDTNALYLSVCLDLAGTTDAPQVYSLEVELVP